MADSLRTRRPRNWLSRREQLRLMSLVGLLGLVLLAMSEARKATHWTWFAAETVDEAAVPAREGSQTHGNNRPLPSIEPTLLESIRDDTPFRNEEHDAWFKLLDVLNTTDEAQLRGHSLGAVTYSQLARQPEQYRGRLVTIYGTIRRAVLQQAPENDYEIEQYFMTILQLEDPTAGQMVVYCLELPEGFPLGLEISAQGEVTGFFFKQQFYEAQDKGHIMPVLLARTVHWLRPSTNIAQAPPRMTEMLIVVAVALAASVLFVIHVYKRTHQTRQSEPAVLQFNTLRHSEQETE